MDNLNISLSGQSKQPESAGVNFGLLDEIILPEQQKSVEDPNADRYIMYSRQIDTHTIKRSRVKITPAVCTVCGLDLVKLAYDQNKVVSDKYEDLPEDIQAIMKQLVIRHNQAAHTEADNLIITKKPQKWLSGRS